MSTPVLIVILFLLTRAYFLKQHKVFVFFAILSLMADVFRLNLGPSLLLINIVGFYVFPIMISKRVFFNHLILNKIRPFLLEFTYLVILGLFFGFIFPWQDLSGERMWTQQAQGRTIISLTRILNEIIILFYFAWVIYKRFVTIGDIVNYLAFASIITFWVGLVDYFLGYTIKEHLFYVNQYTTDRFLGLNGEPKLLGRQGAFAYGILLVFYLNEKRSKLLLFAILTNVAAVVLSLSASSIVLFLLINFIITIFAGKIRVFAISSMVTFIIFLFLQNMSFYQEVTKGKIETALYGVDYKWAVDEPDFTTRFDIFDRLALLYLYQNPKYIITGTGPNLISIPASKNIPKTSVFYTHGRIDSVPNVMFNNVLARSGLVGILLFAIGLFKIFRLSKTINRKYLSIMLLIAIAFSMVYFNSSLLLVIGIIIGSSILESQKNTIDTFIVKSIL